MANFSSGRPSIFGPSSSVRLISGSPVRAIASYAAILTELFVIVQKLPQRPLPAEARGQVHQRLGHGAPHLRVRVVRQRQQRFARPLIAQERPGVQRGKAQLHGQRRQEAPDRAETWGSA